MPRLFGFLIYALGARTVEAQVLITTLIIGNLTLFFCYASIAKISRPIIAFIFCLFLFSDYLLYAQWHVVTYRVWYGFLFFGTLFAISSAAQPGRIWPYLLLGVLFFLLFYFELVFAAYISVLCGIFASFLAVLEKPEENSLDLCHSILRWRCCTCSSVPTAKGGAWTGRCGERFQHHIPGQKRVHCKCFYGFTGRFFPRS